MERRSFRIVSEITAFYAVSAVNLEISGAQLLHAHFKENFFAQTLNKVNRKRTTKLGIALNS